MRRLVSSKFVFGMFVWITASLLMAWMPISSTYAAEANQLIKPSGNEFANQSGSRFEIRDHMGAPALFIDGKPEFAMFLFEQEISRHDAQVFQEAGVSLYSFIELTSFLDLGWIGPDRQDFSIIDRVMKTFVDRVSRGWAMPRIHVWAPQWWLDQHPDQRLGLALPPDSLIDDHVSFASQLWLDEAGDMLRRMVRHMLDSPYGDRLIGITLSAGRYGEWHTWHPEYVPDTSEPMRQYFIRFLREKYADDAEQLRQAWDDAEIDFDSVVIPDLEDRRTSHVGLFRDPAQSQRVIDYYEAYHQSVVDAIDHFARIVKDESDGHLLTSTLYAYSPDMGYMPQEIHHRAAASAMRLESVDMFAGPHSYWRRGPGHDGTLRAYPESLALHGKLFIDEADDRTHLASKGTSMVFATNLQESIGILQRAFAQAVTHGTGLWYMDHSSGLWYMDPAIGQEFKRLKRWGDYSMQVDRRRVSEVAVITSTKSEFYLAGDTDVSAGFYEGPVIGRPEGLGELSQTGTPYDRYLIEDLEAGLIPDRYKVYIFMDAFHLTDGQRRAIDDLKRDGNVLVWTWAPGFADEKDVSVDLMEELTGISFDMTDRGRNPLVTKYRLQPREFAVTETRLVYGEVPLDPIFRPVIEESDQVWALTPAQQPVVLVRDFDDWRSMYVGTPPIAAPVLRRAFSEAGVHIYADSYDPILANASWVSMHASVAGRKTIRLPEERAVYDIINDRLIGDRITEFSFEMRRGETAIFLLHDPSPDSVTRGSE